jgi:Skp family chaperone for outer membrane proteins
MRRFTTSYAILAAGLLILGAPLSARAQDYFVPKSPAQAQRPAPQAGPRPVPGPPQQPEPEAMGPIQAPMPPVPELPPLPRASSPPAAVVGIIGVPEVMRASTAAQQVDKVIGERREKLNGEAQKEQQVWREMQQSLAAERGKLSPEQVRGKEKQLQDRITNAQRSFQARSRIIQEAAQFGLNQIQASLIAVIRQIAESHGMNLVLHRAQVALNVNEFDITEQVTEQLNKLLPTVTIPPEGVSPNTAGLTPTPSAPATPAAAPAKKP